MQQENKSSKKKLLNKFDEVLGSLLPSDLKIEEPHVFADETKPASKEATTHKAYGLIYHKDSNKYEMITIDYNVDTKQGVVVGSEMQRDNFIKALDRVREMYVKDIKFPHLPRNK